MKTLLLDGSESVGEIAERMGLAPSDVVRVGLERLGLMLTLAERRDPPDVVRIAEAFGYRVRWTGGGSGP